MSDDTQTVAVANRARRNRYIAIGVAVLSLPVLSAVLLLIVFRGYIPLQNVVHGTADNLRLAWNAFGQEMAKPAK